MSLVLFFFFLVAAIAGGAWAWNKFGKPCGCQEGK